MIVDFVSITGLALTIVIGYQSMLISQLTSRIESIERTLSDLLIKLSK